VGSFQTYTFVGGRWSNEGDSIDAPFLRVSIHDSDIAIVTYAPGPDLGGLAYLGVQPRDYFEDPRASADVDLEAQAVGLASWALTVAETEVDPNVIRSLLAKDSVEEPMDVFVEETVVRLLESLGVPLPDDFQPTR